MTPIETSKETHPLKGKIIAIDGPAGAGKGTLATTLARKYRLKYLDTGTLYRVVGYKALQKGLNPSKEEDALLSSDLSDYDFSHIGDNQFRVFLEDLDVTKEIRSPEVGDAASKVAFFTSVRQSLKDFQINYAQKWGAVYGVVLDGRDIGTEICPAADFKFFLEASAEARAKRRVLDFEEQGYSQSYEEVLVSILERDARDRGRSSAPLQPASDAVVLDTTSFSVSEVLTEVLSILAVLPYQD